MHRTLTLYGWVWLPWPPDLRLVVREAATAEGAGEPAPPQAPGGLPPAASPERWCPDAPLSPEELALDRQLRDIGRAAP
ncbi:hypothetical protein D7294_19350 [Streptomyces hoynatensis]|uniref:Uncharacterized protein n=1 Tax=Streptomyces hoynatensis TaxID=1141874 RepID=A0A3A9YWS4_9ACTN|nr:hypothetical protein D7294_19350 [Streptomyces hoynatensis]